MKVYLVIIPSVKNGYLYTSILFITGYPYYEDLKPQNNDERRGHCWDIFLASEKNNWSSKFPENHMITTPANG